MDEGNAGRAVAAAPVTSARRIPAEAWRARETAAAILAEARERAEAIRAGAEADAARVRGEAQARAEAARREAVEAGRAEGHADGLARAAGDVLRAAAWRERALSACAGDALELAVAMAARILEREVASPEDARALALRAIRLVGADRGGDGAVELLACPEEVDALAAAAPGWAGCAVRVAGDPGLAPGEVVLRSGASTVDGRFEAQLARLRRELEEGTA